MTSSIPPRRSRRVIPGLKQEAQPPSQVARVFWVLALVAAAVVVWLVLAQHFAQPEQPGTIRVIWPSF